MSASENSAAAAEYQAQNDALASRDGLSEEALPIQLQRNFAGVLRSAQAHRRFDEADSQSWILSRHHLSPHHEIVGQRLVTLAFGFRELVSGLRV